MKTCVAILIVLLPGSPTLAEEAKALQVPYHLTPANHVLVRARLNGKGPYHFLVDTGAPTLFVATAVGKKLGVKPDERGVGTFDRLEIEGGVVLEKVKGRIEDPFQIEGMNKLGLAGAELHGVLGSDLLARFRIELDLTRDKMTWTPLAFKPPPPEFLKGGTPPEVDALGSLSNLLTSMIGKKLTFEVQPRGFLGIELTDAGVIQAVLAKSPAAAAGLKAGDALLEFQGQKVQTAAEVRKLAATLAEGQEVSLTVRRGDRPMKITLSLGKGL